MKKSLWIMALLFMCGVCHAQDVMETDTPPGQVALLATVSASQTVPPAGGGTYYYPSTFNDTSFTSNEAWYGDGYTQGSRLTPAAGTTVVELGVQIYSVGTATTCKIALFQGSALSASLVTNTTFSPTTGWNSAAVSAAITASTEYTILVACNGTFNFNYVGYTGDVGTYCADYTYANFPNATQNITKTDHSWGVRMKTQ